MIDSSITHSREHLQLSKQGVFFKHSSCSSLQPSEHEHSSVQNGAGVVTRGVVVVGGTVVVVGVVSGSSAERKQTSSISKFSPIYKRI